ncbi:MAG: methylmalonyl-CoA mutase [Candidatus Heimdallarchaeota archaeon]
MPEKKTIREEIEEKKRNWEQIIVDPFLKRFPERQDKFVTASGMRVKRLHTPLDVPEDSYLTNIGFPGELPFTRGIQPTMYRGRLWTMRQYAGFGSAKETNKRYKYLLEHGQTGLSVAFDLPTQIGYDSTDPMAEGEVGKCGVAIDSIEDMETLFEGIPLDEVSTSMTINAPAAILLAMYIVVAEKQGVSLAKLRGTIQNDILKEYIARGTYIYPPKPSMRLIADTFEYCSKHLPLWNTISISGYHIREAGSTAVQEVAFTLANGIAYVETALDAGLSLDEFAPRLSFFFGAHTDLFEEVAKFRALRRLWAKIMQERFNAADSKLMRMRFHTQTAGYTLTAQQPENNVVRVTIQALAAVLGGTQSLHTNSRDEALALPTDDSARIALRTQQIIGYESGVTNTIDPLAGSYYIETMTNAIQEEAEKLIAKIDEIGVLQAIESGFIQREIHESAYRYQKEIETNERTIVGVNSFAMDESDTEKKLALLKVDPQIQKEQAKQLETLKKIRDQKKVDSLLENLRKAAGSSENLMPHFIDLVRAKATLGEICNTLRKEFGEFVPTSTL